MPEDAPLAPHPVLPRFYGEAGSREPYVRRLFDETAGDYDRLESMMGLGSGSWYRRRAIRRAGLVPGMKVLDVATGTGLVARVVLQILGGTGSLACLDPCPGMLKEAARAVPVPLVLGEAERLPLRPGAFDFVTMGYALRHVADLAAVFREYRRVLKPGGKACLLELSRPSSRIGMALLKAYMKRVFPALARIATGKRRNAELYAYFWETIEGCLPPPAILDALRAAGFRDASRHVELGIFSEYVATA